MKKLEMGFKNLLREMDVDYELSWEDIRPKLEKEEEFLAFASDSERIKVYKVSVVAFFHLRMKLLAVTTVISKIIFLKGWIGM